MFSFSAASTAVSLLRALSPASPSGNSMCATDSQANIARPPNKPARMILRCIVPDRLPQQKLTGTRLTLQIHGSHAVRSDARRARAQGAPPVRTLGGLDPDNRDILGAIAGGDG